MSYTNPNDSYQNIVDSDLTNSMDGWQHNGNSSSEFIDGSLKVTVDSAWEGIRHNLTDLSVAPGDVFNIRLAFDKGTTQAKVRLYFRELDANGNHLSWNMINGDLQTGNHHNYNYTVNAGSKLVLRIAKDNTYTQDVTHFFIDHVSVTQGDLEIVEENNYYPFGLKHKGYNNQVSANANQVARYFRFGGKEYQEELGIGWYDITARNYDPAIGRWMNLDPLAEEMRRHSPYNYAFDNPIFFIDPDGMKPFGNGDWPNPLKLLKQKVKNGLKAVGEAVEKVTKPIGDAIDKVEDFFYNDGESFNAASGRSTDSGRDGSTGIDFVGDSAQGDQSLKDTGNANTETFYAEDVKKVASLVKTGKTNPDKGRTMSTNNSASRTNTGLKNLKKGMGDGKTSTSIADRGSDAMSNGSLNSSNTSGEVEVSMPYIATQKIYSSDSNGNTAVTNDTIKVGFFPHKRASVPKGHKIDSTSPLKRYRKTNNN